MMSRIFYEDGVREPEHHDPPLGISQYEMDLVNFETPLGCKDCYYPFDGGGWVLCSEHEESE